MVAFCPVDQLFFPIKGPIITRSTRPATPGLDFAQRSLRGVQTPPKSIHLFPNQRTRINKDRSPRLTVPFIRPCPQTECPHLKATLNPGDLAGGGRSRLYSGRNKSCKTHQLKWTFFTVIIKWEGVSYLSGCHSFLCQAPTAQPTS